MGAGHEGIAADVRAVFRNCRMYNKVRWIPSLFICTAIFFNNKTKPSSFRAHCQFIALLPSLSRCLAKTTCRLWWLGTLKFSNYCTGELTRRKKNRDSKYVTPRVPGFSEFVVEQVSVAIVFLSRSCLGSLFRQKTYLLQRIAFSPTNALTDDGGAPARFRLVLYFRLSFYAEVGDEEVFFFG